MGLENNLKRCACVSGDDWGGASSVSWLPDDNKYVAIACFIQCACS